MLQDSRWKKGTLTFGFEVLIPVLLYIRSSRMLHCVDGLSSQELQIFIGLDF